MEAFQQDGQEGFSNYRAASMEAPSRGLSAAALSFLRQGKGLWLYRDKAAMPRFGAWSCKALKTRAPDRCGALAR
jgi:hypothetical protein